MKIKTTITFLFIVLIPMHFSFAIYTPNIGSQSNPLYVQIQPNSLQSWNNAWDKINSMQYVPACSSKYDSIKSLAYKNGIGDIGDPSVASSEANYLNYLYSSYQLCVNNAIRMQNQYVAPQIINTGTLCNGIYWNACSVGKSFVCPSTGDAYCETPKSNDQVCTEYYGINSVFQNFDASNGKRVCGCRSGYVWNDQKTNCIIATALSSIPVKTNNQICQDNYGSKSNWDGTKNKEGGLNCTCISGYQWNTEQTQCVSTPKKEIAPAIKKIEINAKENTNVDVCKSIDPNSYNYSNFSTKEYNVCRCVSGYMRIKSGDPCIIDTRNPTKQINQPESGVVSQIDNTQNIEKNLKPKSKWSKIKGWFGF